MSENDVWDELRRQTERLEKLHRKLEAVKTILVNHSEDDPYVGEASTLQEIADELGIDKGFSIEKLRKIMNDSEFKENSE